MSNISGDTWAALDVVEGKLADAGVQLEEERQRLADTTAGTEDGDFGGLLSCFVSDNVQWLNGRVVK